MLALFAPRLSVTSRAPLLPATRSSLRSSPLSPARRSVSQQRPVNPPTAGDAARIIAPATPYGSALSLAPPPPPVYTSMVLGSRDTLLLYGASSTARCDRPTGPLLASSALGGAYLSFACMLYITVGAGAAGLAATNPGLATLVSSLVFPSGLAAIVLTEALLFTGAFTMGALPFLTAPQRGIKRNSMAYARLLGLSLVGNFAACVVMAAAASSFTAMATAPCAAFAAAIAVKKCSLTFSAALVKGIGANWLVNAAMYMAASARSAGSKVAALWWPIATFVALGLEHSVANMFFLPLGKFLGADVTWSNIIVDNLTPVILGNGIGAALFVVLGQWYSHVSATSLPAEPPSASVPPSVDEIIVAKK